METCGGRRVDHGWKQEIGDEDGGSGSRVPRSLRRMEQRTRTARPRLEKLIRGIDTEEGITEAVLSDMLQRVLPTTARTSFGTVSL